MFSLGVLPDYYDRHLLLAGGVAFTGISIGPAIFAPLTQVRRPVETDAQCVEQQLNSNVQYLTIIRRMGFVTMITGLLSRFRSKHRQIGTGGRSKHGDEPVILLGEIG